MPYYPFICDTCHLIKMPWATITKVVATPTCDNCETPMRRRYDTPATIFKGTGWGKDK